MTDDVGIGHNQPPEPTAIERARELVAAVNRLRQQHPSIENEEVAGLVAEQIEQVRKCSAKMEAEQKAECKPHDRAIVEIRLRYRDPKTLLGLALDAMKRMSTDWLQRKTDKLTAEAAERRRIADEAARRAERAADANVQSRTIEGELEVQRAVEEAAVAQAEAEQSPTRAQVKGDLSSKAISLHTRWVIEIVDDDKALDHFGNNPKVRQAALDVIKRLALALARELKDESQAPPGIRFIKREVAQ